MKLLIFTQKVDSNDPVLGFFHHWIEQLAKKYSEVTVICLQKGHYNLPKNVTVLSLGKEEGISRVKYIKNFYKYIWQEKNNYDAVFVHMNQEYVLLGGVLWKLWGKKIYMWRNHHAGSMLTDIAAAFCTHVFCTSKYSYTAKYKKTILMPVGIDVEIFKKLPDLKKERTVLFLARIAPSKKPHILIEACKLLKERNVAFTASLYGNALPQDQEYYNNLKKLVTEYRLEKNIQFYAGIPNTETVHVYNAHEIVVNLSSSGMYDKTIFEAMACESLSLASNLNLKGEIEDMFLFKENDPEDLAQKLQALIQLSSSEKNVYSKALREYVIRKHSLSELSQRLAKIINNN